MAKQITICGKQLTLAYSMLAAVSFEKMTGKSALDLSQFQEQSLAPIAELGYCMLVASNKEEDVPKRDEVLADLNTAEKLNDFVTAVSDVIVAFYTPSKADQPEQDDAPKNA